MILPCKRNNFLMRFEISNMLVHFTTRVPDTSDTSATRATRVQHKWDMSNMSATRVLHERHKYNMSATRTTLVWHEWKILITRRVKTFSHTYTSYMVNERLQGGEQFHSKNYLSEKPRSHAKMRLKSAPQKLNFVIAKPISKSYTLDCSWKHPCWFPHSYA